MPITSFEALFSLLSTNYGRDGRTNFGIPELRGKVAIGIGTDYRLITNNMGSEGGAESVVLTISQLPQHTHSATSVPSSASLQVAIDGNGTMGSPALGNYPGVATDVNGDRSNTNLGFKCRIRLRGSFFFNQGDNRRDSSAIPRIVNAE